jgi:hypothetical protein
VVQQDAGEAAVPVKVHHADPAAIEVREDAGALILGKLFPDGDAPHINPVDVGGIVVDLTYGGTASYLNVNSAGQMIRQVLEAFRNSRELSHADRLPAA